MAFANERRHSPDGMGSLVVAGNSFVVENHVRSVRACPGMSGAFGARHSSWMGIIDVGGFGQDLLHLGLIDGFFHARSTC